MDYTIYGGFPDAIVINGKRRGARKLMSRDGIQYWYARQSGRKYSILEFQDVANQHAIQEFGTLAGFVSDLVFTPRKPSKRRQEASARMQDMFAQLLEKNNGS